MNNYDHFNAVVEIGELMIAAKELERYEHLGAIAAITEELYFANHND